MKSNIWIKHIYPVFLQSIMLRPTEHLALQEELLPMSLTKMRLQK